MKNMLSVTPYDEVSTYDTILGKFTPVEQTRYCGSIALEKCLNIRCGVVRESPQDCEIEVYI
jgi:hypothetical protein